MCFTSFSNCAIVLLAFVKSFQLESSHKSREAEIKKCIAFHAENIEKLKSSLDKADTMDNVKETKELRNVQRKV